MRLALALPCLVLVMSSSVSGQTICSSGVPAPWSGQRFVINSAVPYAVGGSNYASGGYYTSGSSYGYATGFGEVIPGFYPQTSAASCLTSPIVQPGVVEQPIVIGQQPVVVGESTVISNATAPAVVNPPASVACAQANAVTATDVRSIVLRTRTILVPASTAALLSRGTVFTTRANSLATLRIIHRGSSIPPTQMGVNAAGSCQSNDSIRAKLKLIQDKLARDRKKLDEINRNVQDAIKDLDAQPHAN